MKFKWTNRRPLQNFRAITATLKMSSKKIRLEGPIIVNTPFKHTNCKFEDIIRLVASFYKSHGRDLRDTA